MLEVLDFLHLAMVQEWMIRPVWLVLIHFVCYFSSPLWIEAFPLWVGAFPHVFSAFPMSVSALFRALVFSHKW